MSMCVIWYEFDLVVSICQVIRYKDFSEDAYPMSGDYLQKASLKRVFVCIFVRIFCLYVTMHSFPLPAPHNIYFIHPWHDIAHLC